MEKTEPTLNDSGVPRRGAVCSRLQSLRRGPVKRTAGANNSNGSATTIINKPKNKGEKWCFFCRTKTLRPRRAFAPRRDGAAVTRQKGSVLFNCWPAVFADLFNRMISHGPFRQTSDPPPTCCLLVVFVVVFGNSAARLRAVCAVNCADVSRDPGTTGRRLDRYRCTTGRPRFPPKIPSHFPPLPQGVAGRPSAQR